MLRLLKNTNCRYSVSLYLFLVVFASCVELETVSPIPEISYESLSYSVLSDTSIGEINQIILEFSFIDGDADLGVYTEVHNDTNLPDSARYGLFIELYEKLDGNYYNRVLTQEISDTPYIDTLQLHQLIPYDTKLDREGQNKTVRGYIRSGLPITDNAPYDTMMLEFFIRDRALNKSNVERTDDFTSDVDQPIPNL